MPLFLENPDDRTQPLFDQLVTATVATLGNVPVRISYVEHGVYWVIARSETNGMRWEHVGVPHHILEAFQIWLKSAAVGAPDDEVTVHSEIAEI